MLRVHEHRVRHHQDRAGERSPDLDVDVVELRAEQVDRLQPNGAPLLAALREQTGLDDRREPDIVATDTEQHHVGRLGSALRSLAVTSCGSAPGGRSVVLDSVSATRRRADSGAPGTVDHVAVGRDVSGAARRSAPRPRDASGPDTDAVRPHLAARRSDRRSWRPSTRPRRRSSRVRLPIRERMRGRRPAALVATRLIRSRRRTPVHLRPR